MPESIGASGAAASRLAADTVRSLLSLAERGGRVIWPAVVDAVAGPGEKLAEPVRGNMETLLASDLGDVRVHSGPQVEPLARHLGAEAFTIGSRVFAPPGSLDADSRRSTGLLAHELTHVVQQTNPHATSHSMARVGQRPGGAGDLQRASNDDQAIGNDAAEAEAAGIERSVVSGDSKGKGNPDIDALAERVYRLLKEDLMLERDRRGPSW